MKQLKTLRPRHHTMAALVAANMSAGEIAKRLGMHVNAVYRAMGSPLFKLEVERLTKKNVKEISDNYVDSVINDGARNVRFLKRVRDGKLNDLQYCDPIDRVRLRLDASKTLFDRQMPKKQDNGNAAPQVNIVLSPQEQRVMVESLKAVGAPIKQLDDLIVEYTDEEQRAEARSG